MTLGRSYSRSLWRTLWSCALALLAAGLLAPPAKAGHCGGYVSVDPRFRGELVRLLEGNEAGRRPSLPLPKAPPCNGPSCSGQPAAPIPPTVIPATSAHDWALSAVPVEVDGGGPSPLAPDETTVRPIHRGPSILHPPRPIPSDGLALRTRL